MHAAAAKPLVQINPKYALFFLPIQITVGKAEGIPLIIPLSLLVNQKGLPVHILTPQWLRLYNNV